MEKEKKLLDDSAAEKEAMLNVKLKQVGNYVHDSVPLSDDEVGWLCSGVFSAR